MVMHARKFPRQNDGYYDRGHAHPYEDKNSSKYRGQYNDRYSEKNRDSPSFGYGETDRRDASYPNKSHPEKNKSTKGNMYDSRSNHDRERGVSHKGAGKTREQKERDHIAEVRESAIQVCGDWSEHISASAGGKCYYYNCKTKQSKWEKPKEWITSADSSKGASKQKDSKRQSQTAQRKAAEKRQKHSSSSSATATSRSSDRYQGNQSSLHHVNQYQQQNNFQRHHSMDSQRPGDIKAHHSGMNSNNGMHGGHGSRNDPSHSSNAWPNATGDSFGSSYKANQKYVTPDRTYKGYDQRSDRGSYSASRNTSHEENFNGTRHSRNDYEDFQQTEDMDISPGSTPTEESMMERNNSSVPASTPVAMVTGTPPLVTGSSSRASSSPSAVMSMLSNLTNLSSVDLPALSNLTSLTATSPGGTSPSPSSLLPQLLHQLSGGATNQPPPQPNLGKQQILQQAIQVLQKLQSALLMQQKQQKQRQLQQLLVTQLQQLQQQLQQQQLQQQQQESQRSRHMPHSHQPQHHSKQKAEVGGQSPYSPPDESDGTPLQSPEYNTHGHGHHDDHEGGRGSPHSEHSRRSSRRGSPTPSHTSSQNPSSVGTSQLSAAHRKQESVHISPCLANYYDPSLIDHVSGLIYDPNEKQADLLAEEAHTVGSILCTQVSADLKGARAMVRAGEIISTLHDQRILFIRQQIKDLDGWRSVAASSSKPPDGAT